MAPFILHLPDEHQAAPLLFDSPHSGAVFPDDFASPVSEAVLKTAWDAWVGDLWSGALSHGASLLEATFPRVYIDPNRAPDDIDPALLAAPWPAAWGALNPTQYSAYGMGLIRQYALPGVAMVENPLEIDAVRMRLDDFYRPYHHALRTRLDQLYRQFGAVWHIDCHSMKSVGNAMNIDNGAARPDIVLGDCDGASAAPDFIDAVATAFSARGMRVALNNPYRGGYLVSHYGDPSAGRHSLQIEINRKLYMNEAEFTPNDHFEDFAQCLTSIAGDIAAFVRGKLNRPQK